MRSELAEFDHDIFLQRKKAEEVGVRHGSCGDGWWNGLIVG
jgi:hypothetical protein